MFLRCICLVWYIRDLFLSCIIFVVALYNLIHFNFFPECAIVSFYFVGNVSPFLIVLIRNFHLEISLMFVNRSKFYPSVSSNKKVGRLFVKLGTAVKTDLHKVFSPYIRHVCWQQNRQALIIKSNSRQAALVKILIELALFVIKILDRLWTLFTFQT